MRKDGKDFDAIRKIVNARRRATCGACGMETVVSGVMRGYPDMQYRARPDKPTDVFYCGCQDNPW
jgi:hypothetical protein